MSKVASPDLRFDGLFDVYETGSDGNCLFNALCWLLFGNTGTANGEAYRLRQLIADYTHPMYSGGFESGDEDMRQPFVWGTTLEVAKAAAIFRRPILVYMSKRTEGIGHVLGCPNAEHLNTIRDGLMFEGVRPYLSDRFAKLANTALYCLYLPFEDTPEPPLCLLNINQQHFQALYPVHYKGAFKPAVATDLHIQYMREKMNTYGRRPSDTRRAPRAKKVKRDIDIDIERVNALLDRLKKNWNI